MNETILKSGAGTDIIKLATTIRKTYEKDPDQHIVIRAIGANAINQAYKAVVKCGMHFSQKGITLYTTQNFVTITENNNDSSGYEIHLHPSKHKL